MVRGTGIILLKGSNIVSWRGYRMNSEKLVAIEDSGEKSGLLQGQPEKVMPWTKGNSGISGYSPESEKAITAELKKLVHGTMDDAREGKREKTGARRLAENLLGIALSGGPQSVAATKIIMDRVEGAIPGAEKETNSGVQFVVTNSLPMAPG